MNTAQTWQTSTSNSEETIQLAAQIGGRLKGREVIELSSDLGGGKTTFVKGLAEGLGSQDRVHSPSFTLSNEYKAAPLTLYHFDFYRLYEPGIIRDELVELLNDPQAVIVIEWGNIVEDVLPSKRLSIAIKVTSETARSISISYPKNLSYLLNR